MRLKDALLRISELEKENAQLKDELNNVHCVISY